MNRSTRPLILTILLALIPVAASANAAMSLALTIFPWDIWLVYVGVTVVFEAVALGRWLHVGMGKALRTSIGANLLTALIGALFATPAWIVLGSYGTLLNPNPFGHTLLLFTVFGIGSALVESYMWMRPAGVRDGLMNLKDSTTVTGRDVVRRCIAVHIVGVPVGLAVLLMPSHPYPGLQSQVAYARERQGPIWSIGVDGCPFHKALTEYVDEKHTFPAAQSYEQALHILKPYLGDLANTRELWTTAYLPDYHRFDTHEVKRQPLEWNRDLVKIKDPTGLPGPVWILRNRYYGPYGIVLDQDGKMRRSYNAKELGY